MSRIATLRERIRAALAAVSRMALMLVLMIMMLLSAADDRFMTSIMATRARSASPGTKTQGPTPWPTPAWRS